MRLLLLTQYYPPETGAAPLRARHFAENLAKNGHDVTVVTGMPNHPSGEKHPGYRRRVFAREELNGVRVVRSYLFATPKKTFATRMLNQLSFATSALFAGSTADECDVILVSSPPLFLALTAWLLSLARGTPFVLDLRDYWPHAAVALGELKSLRVIRLATALERFIYRRSARIVCVTPAMEHLMRERGLGDHRLVLITNGADTELFRPGEGVTSPAATGNGGTILYSGTHGLVHGMDTILDAAEILRDEPDVTFLLIGDGVAKPGLMEEASRRGLSNIEFRPSEQPGDLAEVMRSVDVCLATTRPGEFSAGTIPVKLFDYLASAKPVVAAVAGDAKDLIERSGGGIVTEPGDGRALAAAVRALLMDDGRREELGKSGREFVSREYSRKTLARRLTEVLEEVVAGEHMVGGGRMPFRRYLAAKYTLDALTALIVLAVGSPLMALAALLIKIDSPGRALFTQRRIGVHSEEFTIYKFRTMHIETPDLASDLMSPVKIGYVTKIGRLLRKFSADELPNCWNVLKGDMSIVGPRPALYNQHELIDLRRQLRADLMRPGLTGWAQINGRDSIPLDEKVRLDQFYVQNCSLLLDLKIVLRTFSVLRGADEG